MGLDAKCRELLGDLDDEEHKLRSALEYVRAARVRVNQILRGEASKGRADTVIGQIEAYLAVRRDDV